MSTIQVGDRVRWRSTRMNNKGIWSRVGTVLKIFDIGGNRCAWVRPDKGNGHFQYIGLLRLTKVESEVKP